jgi:cytochrome c biogenesis protein
MRLLDFLTSAKLTFVLLVLIVLTAIAGTIIPKEIDNPRLSAFQLDDLYHSFWYTALLVLFCINLVLCSLKNIPILIRSLRLLDETLDLSQMPYYRKLNIRQHLVSVPILAYPLKKALTRKHFYRLRRSDPKKGLYCFERGIISRFGYLITHLSILIILIGGIIVGIEGYKEYIRIPEGAVSDVPNADFKVKVNDFDVQLYPDTKTPKKYVTVLSIIENGQTVRTDNIEVNHPLEYKGIKFLQSDYGFVDTLGLKISKKVNGKIEPIKEFRIDEGQTIEVSEADLKVNLITYMPDFFVDESGGISSHSAEPRNPAVFLEVSNKKGQKERLWLFIKFPNPNNIQKFNYILDFVAIYPPYKYYTGLQVVSDKGISVIWVGCSLIIFGLFLSFYTSHKRIWIKISSDDENTVVEIGAKSYKDRSGFEREFKHLERICS